MRSHRLWGPILGGCGCSAPPGTENSNANNSVHTTNPATVTQNPPLVAQSHLCPKPRDVGHISSPGSDLQVPRCVGSPALGLGMALSSPCHHPLVGKEDKALSVPVVQGWGSSAAIPREVLEGEETLRKWRNAHPARMEAKHLHSPASPAGRGSQGRQTPQSSLQRPQDGAKPQHCRACPVPAFPLTVFSPFPRKDDGHQHTTGPHTAIAAGPPPWGTAVSPEPAEPQPGSEQAAHPTRVGMNTACGLGRIHRNDKWPDHSPANARDPPGTATSPPSGCPEGAQGVTCTARTVPGTSRGHSWHCPCPARCSPPAWPVPGRVPACPLLLLLVVPRDEEWASAPRALG